MINYNENEAAITQYLSNIWSSTHEKVKQHWGLENTVVNKKVCNQRKACSMSSTAYAHADFASDHFNHYEVLCLHSANMISMYKSHILIQDEVFKNEPSKIWGKRPLKNLKDWFGLL